MNSMWVIVSYLARVTYPDERTRTYLYEPEAAPLMTIPSDALVLAALYPRAYLSQSVYTGVATPVVVAAQRTAGRASRFPVTGILDELGNRYASYEYDNLGRVVRTERAGSVQRYGFVYPTATRTLVVEPLGPQRTHDFQHIAGVLSQVLSTQPAGAGCGPSSSAITYDAQANVSSRTDFNNNKICYAYDLSRNLRPSESKV